MANDLYDSTRSLLMEIVSSSGMLTLLTSPEFDHLLKITAQHHGINDMSFPVDRVDECERALHAHVEAIKAVAKRAGFLTIMSFWHTVWLGFLTLLLVWFKFVM